MSEKLMKEKLNEEKESLKLRRRTKREKIRERGITLIALVVTIIILLILAGVTLNIALSDGGLFSKTKEAAEDYKQAQTNEEGLISNLEKDIDKYGSGNPSTVSPTPTEGTPTTIQDAKSKDYTFENTTTVTDGNGNKVVIPGKFKIASNSGTTVKEGIVVEDTKGNQFVWIPVSNVDGGKDQNGSNNEENLIKVDSEKEVEITLGRYTFATDSTGTPTIKQKGSECETDDENFIIDTDYKENTQANGENEKAKDLKAFVDSVNKNHGYYIARYEAGQDNGTPISKMGSVWNNVTQLEASTAAKEMYKDKAEEANYVESDLVNSYAWDTAIVYIQEMKEENKNYANQSGDTSGSLKNTGETGDEKCHIFDMAGNVLEWTTEYSKNTWEEIDYPCVYRGGVYEYGDFTADRSYTTSTSKDENIGFRMIFYLK